MSDQRPSADALLARIKEKDRARLRIYIGAAPGVGEEVSAAVEAESSRLFSLLGSQLRVAFGNLALEGGAT